MPETKTVGTESLTLSTTAPESPPYRIFISYTNEDKAIASAIHNTLKTAYPASQDLKVTLMKEFEPGGQWRKQIDEALTNADLLLLVYTGQLKPSHSWTGYEVGFFSREIQRENARFPNVQREIIPINFLGEREAVTEIIEGIEFKNEEVTRPDIDIPHLGLTSENYLKKFSEGPCATDQLFKLLRKVANNIEKCTSRNPTNDDDRDRRDTNLRREVVELYKNLHSLLRQRQKKDYGLQSKLIISIADAKASTSGTNLLTIDFQNGAESVFQLGEVLRSAGSNRLDWPVFEEEVAKKNDKQVAALWVANLGELIRSAHQDEFVDPNLIFPSHDQTNTYRAVVTRRVEFYSGRRDIHIYLFQRLKRADYGDTGTSLYLNAIQVACRYRSLFLEPLSEFSPPWMHPHEDNKLRNEVLRLIRELDLVYQDSLEARLSSTQSLGLVYGEEGAGLLARVKNLWTESEGRMRLAAANLVQCNDPAKFASVRAAFEKELLSFCIDTNPVNADYLKRAIQKLEKRTAELMDKLDNNIIQWSSQGPNNQQDSPANES